jgi:CubicO group peptidase (beta-lactamase class C family)
LSRIDRFRFVALLAVGACSANPPATPATPAPLASSSNATVAPPKDAEPFARQRFTAWLDAFNSHDRAKLRAFYVENADPNVDERVEHYLDVGNFTGAFDLKKTEADTPTRFQAVLKARESDLCARMLVEVATDEPHRAVSLHIEPIATPDDLLPPRASESEVLQAMQQRIDAAVAADRFSGTVLVAKNGAPLFARAYGLADREHKIPNELATRFRIGSMNKMFTATAVLQLVQAKKLSLGDTLGKLVPDYPNKNVATKVTVENLLSHTGGTGDIFGPEFDAHRETLRTLGDYVKLYGNRDLEFEPGSRWDYSNYGFILLGVIIERVTGRSYYDWVAAHVFKPAGMTSTDSLPEDQAVAKRSVGYMKHGGATAWETNASTLPYRGTSAGGGYSAVEDLLRFANALRDHKLLDAAHTALLTTGKTDVGVEGARYAYGFDDVTISGVRCIGHDGGAPGMNGDLAVCDSGYTIAVLSNLDPPAAQNVSDFVRLRLPRQ